MINQTHFDSIHHLFNQNNIFIVPTFQRPYRWEERQVDALIDDIVTASIGRREHYISPVHLIAIDTTKKGDVALLELYTDAGLRPIVDPSGSGVVDDAGIPVSFYLVVDGQQRLTSTIAVFTAFQVPITWTIRIGGIEFPKLISGSTSEDAAIRRGLGIAPGTTPGITASTTCAANRINDAFGRAAYRAAGIAPGHVAFLQRQLKTLAVCLEPAFALGAFLTLNDRGKDLTTLEKLKAHCMYIDSQASAPNPRAVHTTFGALYRTLEHANSVITDDQAVQIATLFLINGAYKNTAVLEWSGQRCFDDVLSIELTAVTLGSFLNSVAEIARAHDVLIQGLQAPGTTEVFLLALKQRELSHRALAIVMKFQAAFGFSADQLAQQVNPAPLWSNSAIASYLATQLATQVPSPALQNRHLQISTRISGLAAQGTRELSVLDMVVMVDACGLKTAAFLGAWSQAFAGKPAVTTSMNSWSNYLQTWNSRFNYLRELLSSGDVSPSSLRYKVALLWDLQQGRAWPDKEHNVEHVFAENLPTWQTGGYGFTHSADYDAFCNQIGNIVPLDAILNKSIGANDPITKAVHYLSQTTLGGNIRPPTGSLPHQFSPAAFELGRDLTTTPVLSPREQRELIELRNIEMVCFAAAVL